MSRPNPHKRAARAERKQKQHATEAQIARAKYAPAPVDASPTCAVAPIFAAPVIDVLSEGKTDEPSEP